MQEKSSAAGAPGGGAYSAPPDPLAGEEGDWLPQLQLPRLLSALRASLLLFPRSKIMPLGCLPLDARRRRPRISNRLRLKLVFSYI